MLRVERVGKRLKSFAGLRPRSLEEFYELGDFIANSPTEFFGELGESYILASSGVHIGGRLGCYVDALAVDESGAVVVVLIVPADEARPIERAMTAASQTAALGADGLLASLGASKAREVRSFLGQRSVDLNRKQRVLLLAENFDDALLATANWLSGGYGVDLECVQVTLAQDPATGEEFLRCERIGPRPARREPPPVKASTDTDKAPRSDAESSFPTGDGGGPVAPLPDNLFDPAIEELSGAANFAPAPEGRERRVAPRNVSVASSAVELQYAGRALAAGIVDYCSGGVGVTLHSPLPVGAEVKVRGKLTAGGTEIELARGGRVVHCSFVDSAFRLGVAFTGNGVNPNEN